MSYYLGVDLGTTFVAAAVARDDQVTMVPLGERSVVLPSVVYVRGDGVLVTGESAGRRMVSNPGHVVSEVKRRMGDPTPLMIGGSAYPVTDLLGTLLRDVLDRVAAEEGGPPAGLLLTHPANWGPYQQQLFAEVPRFAGVERWRTVTEPEAAAAHYAATRSLAVGEVIAVYDLGGGTFDATVLGRTENGIEVLGTPQGIERLGGADLDQAILTHVNHVTGGALSALDMRDASTVVALARLRQDCVLAKEALSLDTEATIPVSLPGRHLEVELTRWQFEELVRAHVESTIGALGRALRSASVAPETLSAVLLVGGSSHIPLIPRMIEEQLGCRTVVDTHPKHAVALGAALLSRSASSADAGAPVLPLPRVAAPTTQPVAAAAAPRGTVPAPVAPPAEPVAAPWTGSAGAGSGAPPSDGDGAVVVVGPEPESPAAGGSGRRRRGIAVAASLLVLAGAGGAVVVGTSLSGPGSTQHQPAGGVAAGGAPTTTPDTSPATTSATTSAVVLPTDVPGLVDAVNRDPSLAGDQAQTLVTQLGQVAGTVAEARRQASIQVLGTVGQAAVRPDLAAAVRTAVGPYTVLDTPAQMIADLQPNPALGGPKAILVLNCMKEFLGKSQQLQQAEASEILKDMPSWTPNGGLRQDLADATVKMVTPVAQGQKVFTDAEAAGGG